MIAHREHHIKQKTETSSVVESMPSGRIKSNIIGNKDQEAAIVMTPPTRHPSHSQRVSTFGLLLYPPR